VRFRLLGAVDADSAGQPVDVGHARMRCVLVVLLVDANRFVSVGQLMERVWGDHPPQRGREVLYSYLSRLRAIFAAEHGVTIERRPGGYLLAVDETAVDLHQFRDLIGRARSASEDTDALVLLDQALLLWRGTAFTGLDTPWLNTVREALDIERRTAELERTDAALRCGQHARLLADLTSRAAQEPFDERIAGQLMLALAGTGRQAKALSVYQSVRQALLDELGLEPGPELRRLHEQVLAGNTEPTLVEPVSSGERTDVIVPRQLPASARHFTGRHAELKALVDILESSDAAGGTVVISAIDGMAGVGKTALAVHAAHRVAGRFPDGVLFADLHGFTPEADPVPPEQVLDQLLRGLGVPGPQIPADLDGRAGLYRSVLADRRVLIVLDNAADETHIEPLLPATALSRAIVTSRRRLAGLDDATHLSLSVLDPAEASDLFRSLAGDRVHTDDQPAVEQIIALCGRLPLAIRITAARLRLAPAGTPAMLRAELADALDAGRGMEWLSDGHRAIGAALAVSYRHLTDDQRRVFRLVGLHPGTSIEPYAVAALADTTVTDARRLLQDLYSANLVNQPFHRRYTLHDLVGAYVGTLATDLSEADRHAVLGRLYDHYAATSFRAVNLVRPWEIDERPDPPAADTPVPDLATREEAQTWLDTETDNLLATAHQAATRNRPDHLVHQSATLRRYLRSHGHYGPAILLHQEALAIVRATDDRAAQSDALNGLGILYRLQARYAEAVNCFEQASVNARATGDDDAEQEALLGLGAVHWVYGRYGPAADCYLGALDGARRTGNRTAEQHALCGLGHVHYPQSQYDQAIDCFEQALDSACSTGNLHAEREALRGLGTVNYVLGRHESAVGCYQQALDSARRDGDRTAEQDALRGLGMVRYQQGRYESAADCLQQALENARRTGNRGAVHETLIGLGNIHRAQGRHTAAADCFGQLLVGAEQIGDRNVQFEAHRGLGKVRYATNDHHEALRHNEAALRLATELDQPADQARAHDGLALAHLALTDPNQAYKHWSAALELLTTIGIDHTEEPDVTTETIRAHLLDIDAG
jgi:DNA-binding SARP family transcriptional activator/tetratricopeptide (TPR) repeat protein